MKIRGIFASREVYIGDRELLPGPSRRLCNHSPDGFNWGYGGSGPAQLALALLLEVTTPEEALQRYQDFKWDVIARLPSTDFEMLLEEVQAWLGKNQQSEEKEGPFDDLF